MVLGMLAFLGLGAEELHSLAKSGCRVGHYFTELSTADAHMNPMERLLISFVLAQNPN